MASKLGWGREAIIEHLKKVREKTEVIYTLETLTYLARGGRIGRVQALAGSLLKLKPVIKVEKADGKYSTAGKERTMPRALGNIRDYLEHVYGRETPLWVSVLHGQFEEQAQALSEMLKSRLNIKHLEVLRISPVLGVHTGPGVVGAAVVPYSLMKSVELE
jgi:DegV family protein with EDD domain